MSRTTLILLGLLAGSFALVGCSKNITAPSVETERQPQALTGQAVPVPDEIQVDDQVGPAGQKGAGNKLRRTLMDDQVGEGGQEIRAPRKLPNNPGDKLRKGMFENETLGGSSGTVAPAPDPRDSEVF